MRTLISALDWGLGHTTRIIPVIKGLQDKGEDVILAGSQKQKAILGEFFPDLLFVNLPSSEPIYSKSNSQILSLFWFIPKFVFSIGREYYLLKKLIPHYKINKVVSDNRYGLYNRAIQSIIVCHQLTILLPARMRFLEPLVNRINRKRLNKFNECWVPDFQGQNSLGGELSIARNKLLTRVKYIGILSRFSLVEAEFVSKGPDLLILISGPENQRTVFEERMLSILSEMPQNIDYLIIRGLPNTNENTLPHSLNHCSTAMLKALILASTTIICRAGYSSIMDLVYLKKSALLVPTPGQTEQEYLADYLMETKKFLTLKQDALNTESVRQYLIT
jgi:UDP:flavonoid glycosyltransferase YjiC (YdhE family)